jgi:hypothetical protein
VRDLASINFIGSLKPRGMGDITNPEFNTGTLTLTIEASSRGQTVPPTLTPIVTDVILKNKINAWPLSRAGRIS